MCVFSITIGVGNPGGDMTEVSVVVDTGAYHTMLPKSLLAQLRIQPNEGCCAGNYEIGGISYRKKLILVEFISGLSRLETVFKEIEMDVFSVNVEVGHPGGGDTV